MLKTENGSVVEASMLDYDDDEEVKNHTKNKLKN